MDNNSTMLSFYTNVLWVSNLTRVSKGVYVQVEYSQCRWYHILQPTWYLHLYHCKILWYSPIHLDILCQVTHLGFLSIHLFNRIWKKTISTQHYYTTTRIWTQNMDYILTSIMNLNHVLAPPLSGITSFSTNIDTHLIFAHIYHCELPQDHVHTLWNFMNILNTMTCRVSNLKYPFDYHYSLVYGKNKNHTTLLYTNLQMIQNVD